MMKRKIIYILIAVLLFSLVGFSMIYLASQNDRSQITCKSCASLNSPSFSGKYMLEVKEIKEDSQNYNYFQIRDNTISYDPKSDPSGNIIFVSDEKFRVRDALYFLWDDEGRVWVYSGDLGTFFWVKEADEDWHKYRYADEAIQAPYFLKEVRPQYHQK